MVLRLKRPGNGISPMRWNEITGGRLIMGIDDNSNMVGVDETNIFELKDKIVSLIYDGCYPNILPEIYTLTIQDKLLLVIEVFRGNLLPCYLKKEVSILYATNALLIALGYYEHCGIKCARFKGTTMEVFIDKKEYTTDIFSILNNALSFIQNHINLHGEIKGLYRIDTYEIPTEALREALINALIHRDYTHFGRDIKVGVYDDIVNIVSPGNLPHNITLEDIFNGRSETRNKVLANLFKELELIEKWGTGIKRIKSLCREKGLLEPLFSEKNDFVDIEFYRENKTTQEIRSKQSTKDKIITLLKENNTLTRDELSQQTDVSTNAIKQHLAQLKEQNKLKRVGSNKSGHWEVL